MPSLPLTRRSIFAQAWPIMLGQTTVPLVGLVDVAVIGRTGDAAALAGVALGTTIVNFLFWSFGFLRMGMTGMTAQAEGAGDAREVDAMLVRGVAVGLGIGALLTAAQLILIPAAFAILAGGPDVDASAEPYVAARFLGAPASLAVFAINGWLLGLGRSRTALALQIVMNLVNAGLDILFVWHFGMGARGVGLGTACAEWTALATGLLLVAFVLDGFAFTAESRVGQAIGARSRTDLVRAIRLTGEFSFGFAALACVLIFTAGAPGIAMLVTNQAIRDAANMLLPLVAILPLLGTPAWLLDGIFIGATGGRALRNAAILSTTLYIATDLLLRPWGIWGLWAAFLIAYLYRAAALGAYLPGLLRSLSAPMAPAFKSES